MGTSFVDRRVFVQASPEGELLVKALAELYGLPKPAQDIALQAGIENSEVDWVGTMLGVWPRVLVVAARKGVLRTLVSVVRDRPESAARRDYFSRLLEAPVPDAGVDYYSAAVLPARRSMIDRRQLRGYLKDLAADDGSKVLVVSGAPGLGKSHTWLLISYLADRTGAFTPVLVDASRRAGAPMTALEVASDIAAQVGWPAPPDDLVGQPPTIVRKLAVWFTQQARQLTEPVWLVFDGFVDETADCYAQSLVAELVVTADRSIAPRLRVTLLEFGGQLDAQVGLYALQESIGRPSRADCVDYFRAAARHYDPGPVEDAVYDELVTVLLGPSGDGEHLSLAELGVRAADLARTAFADAP